jgi:hypothetical protein
LKRRLWNWTAMGGMATYGLAGGRDGERWRVRSVAVVVVPCCHGGEVAAVP